MNAEELREIIQNLREVGADLTHIEVTKSDAQRLALAYVHHLAQSAEPYRVHVECGGISVERRLKHAVLPHRPRPQQVCFCILQCGPTMEFCLCRTLCYTHREPILQIEKQC